MAGARYSIGIDLGTTNSALAFAPLVGDAKPEVLLVPQWESLTALAEQPTLPSFLYLPEEAVAAQLRTRNMGAGEWIVVALTVIEQHGFEGKSRSLVHGKCARLTLILQRIWRAGCTLCATNCFGRCIKDSGAPVIACSRRVRRRTRCHSYPCDRRLTLDTIRDPYDS